MPSFQHLSVSTWYTLPSTLTSPAQGLGCPSPRGSSLCNTTILVTGPFYTFGLLAAAPGSSISSISLPVPIPRMARLSLVMSTLDCPRCLCPSDCALPLIHNKLAPLPYLEAVATSLFVSFFIHSAHQAGLKLTVAQTSLKVLSMFLPQPSRG